ncbi:MAG: hypothetical protein HY773_01410 [Candidatus Terrybacteria bacterium]|nr:hypothetical protein [Candidatus Terrybacteria bacterium]
MGFEDINNNTGVAELEKEIEEAIEKGELTEEDIKKVEEKSHKYHERKGE